MPIRYNMLTHVNRNLYINNPHFKNVPKVYILVDIKTLTQSREDE